MVGERSSTSHTHISMPEAGGSWPQVIRGELVFYHINCNTGENGPYTMPAQYSRADPEGVDVEEPTLGMWKQGN